MGNDLVGYSRAGDVFHYRWAARRCLKLILPNTILTEIHIEGSSELEKSGEYVIDVSEYSIDQQENRIIEYYQLKHSTVQANDPFTLSDLKDTIEGFAKRYKQHRDEKNADLTEISFTIITNRKIADSFKENVGKIVSNGTVNKGFLKTIKKYTELSDDELSSFCNILNLDDGEGDYNIQRDDLRKEMAQLIAGSIDNTEINNLISLVQEKVLPDSNGTINKEEVLNRFGITSERNLYPAPPKWEKTENIIERNNYIDLRQRIEDAESPVIIHAVGGVGKTVFCRQFISILPDKHLGIAYDCFGAGSYRNRSEPRHGHRHALVQIANELAAKGLCNPLLVKDTTLDEDIMRQFLLRIRSSITSLKKVDETAKLFILIDAADNAELAAKQNGENCFAKELLRETIPQDCKLILLCRPERIDLLQPESYVLHLELESFSIEESLINLRNSFPQASEEEGLEFHRLTSNNPRVQANSLDEKHSTVEELLASLSPSGTTVQDQIAAQLNTAVSNIKDRLPKEQHEKINSICLGLASLPPLIPIEILSLVSEVSTEDIKSFTFDLGRSLWISDDSIKFRDEPTETWFRETYLATEKDFEEYIKLLEPKASIYTYVSEVLPQLYLQAGQYGKLIKIALSDDFLPENNPIDARNIRVYRLQFAFKASLIQSDFKNAVKLAMRAGEEVAGNQRQLDLFFNNTDLIPILQSKEKVQEIAFKKLLNSEWDGSENVYSASLLSGIKDYHGEASGYLRAALNWLTIFYEEFKKDDDDFKRNQVSDNDLLELSFAHLNILGVKNCVNFLKKFSPKSGMYTIVKALSRRLIDLGRFEEINEFLKESKDEVYFIVAVTSELQEVGRFPDEDIVLTCIKLLSSTKKRIAIPKGSYGEPIVSGIISFLEACLFYKLEEKKILTVINHYTDVKASRLVYDTHYSSDQRTIFLKALAIKAILLDKQDVDIQEITPSELNVEKRSYEQNQEFDKLREVINILFPWFLLRVKMIYIKEIKLFEEIRILEKKKKTYRYNPHNTLPQERIQVLASIVLFYNKGTSIEVQKYFDEFLSNEKGFGLQIKIKTLRAAFRLQHLECIRQPLESNTYQLVKNYNEEGTEELVDKYVALSRAVLVDSIQDSSEYFDQAIKITSKFGYEIVDRWNALVSLAEKSCEHTKKTDELAYRFIRCAELVGENVPREKHWNRGKAIRISTRMSPGVGLSALSRWRDRDIGRYRFQFEDVMNELVDSKTISSSIGWSLTSFYDFINKNSFLSLCLESELSYVVQQNIFQDAVYDYQLKGTSTESWRELKKISSKFNITNKNLDDIIALLPSSKISDEKREQLCESPEPKINKEFDTLFQGIDLVSVEGVQALFERFKTKKDSNNLNWRHQEILDEAILRINTRDIWSFIEILFLIDEVSQYDIEKILSSLPEELKSKVSFKRNFEKIIFSFGERFAHKLIGEYLFYFLESFELDNDSIKKLKSGILSGLAKGVEFTQSNVFFGFVSLASTIIEDYDAQDLLDYSLSRFELHIDEEFGDGEWSDKLIVSDDIYENLAGYLWSALGSPRSEVRWNTAHCVRKLAKFKCVEVINELGNWLELGKVNAFGSFKYPFYDLHAKQYLLMAFESISFKYPEMLRAVYDLFIDEALKSNHILIQQYASAIIQNIEKSYPKSYDTETLDLIKEIGKSPFEILEKDYNYSINSYWHNINKVNIDLDYNFGYEMLDYWYKPLGKIFGVPAFQIKELASQVIYDWQLDYENGYNNDPRVDLWDKSTGMGETYYYKSSYPKTDNFDFYVQYHAMMVIAAKLLKKMPIIKTSDWEDDPWGDWISRHTLIFNNGMWLSDYRDKLPFNRPQWIAAEKSKFWQSSIDLSDFIFYLLGTGENKSWITVRGGLHEKIEERKEVFSVSTALVSKSTSTSLLNALSTCADPMDFKLPDFDEERAEIKTGVFELTGWLSDLSVDKRIEELDPQSFGLNPPSFIVHDKILNKFDLVHDDILKDWKIKNTSKTVIKHRSWSSLWKGKDEEVNQSGTVLTADISFLKDICKTLDCELIFDVSLKRDIYYKYSQDKQEYIQPTHKIFILSSDGKLRTTEANYQIG